MKTWQSIIVALLCLIVSACAAQNTVTVKRNRAGLITAIESNAKAAYYRDGKERIGYENMPDWWLAFWLGVGGYIGNNTGGHFGYVMHDVNRTENREIHHSGGVDDTLTETSTVNRTNNEQINYSGQVDVDHNYDGSVDINGTGGWDSDHHIIWGP